MRVLLSHYFGCFSILLMGILTLLLPGWLRHWILTGLKKQEWVSIEFFRIERLNLEKFITRGAFVVVLVSWLVTDGFTSAFILGVFLPLGVFLITTFRYRQFKNQLAREFLPTLYSLKGLVEIGTPFPQALSLLSEEFNSPLTLLLKRSLRGFQKGKSLESNFRNLETKKTEEWTFRSLLVLEKAYRKGLALCPLIENIIHTLELEFQTKDRLKQIQSELWIQVVCAASIPWILVWVCWTFQPDIVKDLFQSLSGKVFIFLIFVWEGIGIWCVRKIIRFY